MKKKNEEKSIIIDQIKSIDWLIEWHKYQETKQNEIEKKKKERKSLIIFFSEIKMNGWRISFIYLTKKTRFNLTTLNKHNHFKITFGLLIMDGYRETLSIMMMMMIIKWIFGFFLRLFNCQMDNWKKKKGFSGGKKGYFHFGKCKFDSIISPI